MSKYPGISEPEQTIESMHNTILELKKLVEIHTQQAGERLDHAVTFRDLVERGIIQSNKVDVLDNKAANDIANINGDLEDAFDYISFVETNLNDLIADLGDLAFTDLDEVYEAGTFEVIVLFDGEEASLGNSFGTYTRFQNMMHVDISAVLDGNGIGVGTMEVIMPLPSGDIGFYRPSGSAVLWDSDGIADGSYNSIMFDDSDSAHIVTVAGTGLGFLDDTDLGDAAEFWVSITYFTGAF